MEATKPKGVVHKPKRARKLPKLNLAFEEQTMADPPTTWITTDVKEYELSPLWRKTFDENYAVFRDNLKPQKVIELMPFTDEQRKEMKNMVDDHCRTDHLIKRVIPNGCKSLVETFINALKMTGQEHLIHYVPGERGLKRQLSQDSGCKSERNVPADDTPLMIHVNGQKYLKLIHQHDKPIINLREYITDVDGKLHPTKKGILLTKEDWDSLIKVDISTLIESKANA